MVGTPCCPRLGDRKSPAFLARRQYLHPTLLQHTMFGLIVDVAMERHSGGDAQQRGMVDEPLLPPAAAEDVQMQVRHPGSQRGDRLQRVLNLLVRHQA